MKTGQLVARFLFIAVGAGSAATTAAQSIAPEFTKECAARPLGPAATGGRIVDVAVNPKMPWRIYAASASGGVWRSDNNGTTWQCIFDRALSIGDIAGFLGDPDVLWVGTGEANNQRSSYAGNGVWLTKDAGKSWQCMGVTDSHHVARIATDPSGKDPNFAVVAVMGHLYTKNAERGLFKTTDGGATWEKVLYRGDGIGATDVLVDPRDTKVIYASTYERTRRAWNFSDVGDAAIYKSVNGGASWKRLAGGLPSGKLGRIGLALARKNPDLLYACIDNQNLAPPEAKKEGDAKPAPPQPIGGEVYRSLDGGATWEKRSEKPVSGEPPYYYGQIRVDPFDADHVWLLGIVVFVSKDGGKTWSQGEAGRSLHSDHHALWFDGEHRGRMLLGNDGGLAQSYDSGQTWDYYPNLPVAQFYTVSVDGRRPYDVYGGLQDNGVWRGPSRSRDPGGAGSGEWRHLGGADGMYVLADPADPDTVYFESQFGALERRDLRSDARAWIQPRPEESPGDGKSANRQKKPADDQASAAAYRFNWCSPLVLSQFNSHIVYLGGQCLWKSLDRGDHWRAASGDLTTNDAEKLKGNVPHCTITSISESPLDPDLLLIGTDDGNVQWTEDGGKNWTNLAGRFPELPPHLWCSRVELSRHDRERAWVTFTGYREDDFRPWVYRTSDGAKSFELVNDGLPDAPVNVLHESPRRADVLFLGGDAGPFVSIDGGDHWSPLGSGMPVVSILDLAVHPEEREVVLATHGLGMYVVDVAPFEQLDDKVLDSDLHLFAPSRAVMWRQVWGLGGFNSGDRKYRAPVADSGAALWYWSGAQGAKATLRIVDAQGKVLRTLACDAQKGLNRVVWNFDFDPPAEAKPAPKKTRRLEPGSEDQERERAQLEEGDAKLGESELEEAIERELGLAPDDGRKPGARRGSGPGGAITPGHYTVRLQIGEKTLEQPLEIEADDDSHRE